MVAAMKNALLIVAGAIVLTTAALALFGVVLGQEKITTHPVAGTVREIVVKSDSGDVRLIRAGTQVQVRETQHYVLQKPTLEQDLTDGVLTLETDCDSFFFNCSADLRVTVPAGVRISVEADSGDVHADGIETADVRTESDSGDVHLELVGRQERIRAHSDSRANTRSTARPTAATSRSTARSLATTGPSARSGPTPIRGTSR